MNKLFGLTIGGLKHKILNLVMVIFFVTLICGIGLFVFHSKALKTVVSLARHESQTAINEISTETMHEVMENSLTKVNGLQAYVANDMFDDTMCDVLTLQSLATGLFEHRENFEPYPYHAPRMIDDGTYTAQALSEEGVNINDSVYLPIAAHMSDTMVAMCNNSIYMNNCYIGLEDGTILCVDDLSANKFDADGNVTDFPVRDRFWYEEAKETGSLYFSGVMYDMYTGKPCVACAAPVYAHGELIGVVGMDLFLDDMEEYVNESASEGGFITIINDRGQVVFAPEGNGVFEIRTSDEAEDLRNSEERELADFVSMALRSPTGLRTLNIGGVDYYAAATPMDRIGWIVVTIVSKKVAERSTTVMLSEYDNINDEATRMYNERTAQFRLVFVVLIILIMAFGVTSTLLQSDKIVKPIEAMTAAIVGSTNGNRFEMKDQYRTGDEIEILAESFDDLSRKTHKYIEEITAITSEKERIGTELALANQIQTSMLPHDFPPFPDRKEFDIYATMDPAREVGGDFYDFFFIDEDHLCLVIADVSGKGVPAALFMMNAKTMIRSYAVSGKSVSEIIQKTNESICQNNQAEMFVTVWIGILDVRTGIIKASNAGHEYPILRRSGENFSILKEKHGLPVGAMEDMVYREYEIKLGKDDVLFLYTDGVPEAANAEDKLFGDERMIKALDEEPEASVEDILRNVRAAVERFVGEAEQFDDLTMMCIKYYGNNDNKKE